MEATNEPLVTFVKHGRIDVGTVHASSVLSTINIDGFGQEVLAFVEANAGLRLLLSFEHVDYLSSAVLTELLRVNKAVQEGNGELRLCAVCDNIREVFEITNLDQLFSIHEDDVDVNLRRFERSIDIADQDAAWDAPGT